MANRFRWVFFDVGSVLMDEGPWLARYYEDACTDLCASVPSITPDAFAAAVEAGRRRTDCTPLTHALEQMLPDAEAVRAFRRARWERTSAWYYDLAVPAAGVHEMLAALQGRYRLGVIANQQPAIHAWMASQRLDTCFDLEIYDCDVGVAKPETRLFRLALERAGCRPQEAVMVGDRVDNDIVPARAVGMATIWVRGCGEYGNCEPSGPDQAPDAVVRSVAEVPSALEALEQATE